MSIRSYSEHTTEKYLRYKLITRHLQVGHGLHLHCPAFQKYTNSAPIAHLVQSLGWRHPVVPQSMYIFKQARIGGEVTAHQDSTFLHTTPNQSCLGLWLALPPPLLEPPTSLSQTTLTLQFPGPQTSHLPDTQIPPSLRYYNPPLLCT